MPRSWHSCLRNGGPSSCGGISSDGLGVAGFSKAARSEVGFAPATLHRLLLHLFDALP